MPRKAPRIAIVGANARGLYTLDLIMRCNPTIEVELIDPLPAPVGIAALRTSHPLARKIRVTGNVSLSPQELEAAFDAVLTGEGDVEKALSATSRPLPDFHTFLRERGVPFTPWIGTLDIPSDRTLAQWEEFVATAHGAPVCF